MRCGAGGLSPHPPRPMPRPVQSGREGDAPTAAAKCPDEQSAAPARHVHSPNAHAAPLDRPIAITVPHEDHHGRGYCPLPVEPVHVQGVVLGNLPGLGRPWLAQYGHHLSRCGGGAVAMLELTTDHARLELVDARTRGGAAGPVEASTVVELLTGLFAQVHLGVKVLLVLLPQPLSPRTLEQVQAIQYWTICCGTDQAAMQGALHILSELNATVAGADAMAAAEPAGVPPALGALNPDAADGRPEAPERWGVMLMGCDESRSQAAARQLAEQARPITGSLALRGYRRRMQPVHVDRIGEVALCETESVAAPHMALAELFEALRFGRRAELDMDAPAAPEHGGEAPAMDEGDRHRRVQLDELYRNVLDSRQNPLHPAAPDSFKSRREPRAGSRPVRLSPKVPPNP